MVNNMIEKMKAEAENVDPDHCVEAFQNIILRYENIFPGNHCNILKMKVNIAKSIGYEEGFLQHELDTDDLKMKAKMCRDIINVLGLLEPGLTNWRAYLIYEASWTEHALLLEELKSKTIKIKIFKKKILQVLKNLRFAQRCLEDNGRKEDEDLGKKISLLIRRIES